MRLSTASLALSCAAAVSAVPSQSRNETAKENCRFVHDYTQDEILEDTTRFVDEYLYWESKFHQHDMAFNEDNGMAYDGAQIDWTTGLVSSRKDFSAASTEALQIMVYAQVIAGREDAARFISPGQPHKATKMVVDLMETKLEAYFRFNETYPGFGGMLPWVLVDEKDVIPMADWHDRIPGLDNGELLWAVYSIIEALEGTGKGNHKNLADKWAEWLEYTKETAREVFYMGDGEVCAVTTLNETLPVWHPDQEYHCENEDRLDDPYEGELLTWWLHFYAGLDEDEKLGLWEYKRAMFRSVEYEMGGVGPVTVQEGFWFSSHEPWKLLQMPFYDVDLLRRVVDNGEKVRTCNSVITKNPGMFASVNNSTDPETQEIIGYISNAGIPSISSMPEQVHDVITPYAVYPVILSNKEVGLAWLRNILLGKKMQNPYGTTESGRIDGTLVSAVLTWDSKVLTVAALLGGTQDLTRTRMKRDGLYDEFIEVNEREHELTFPELKGEDLEWCLPEHRIAEAGLEDFTECQ